MNINATLLGQTIVFVIFVWFCIKFIWPPIIAAMEERKKRIENGLLAAQRGIAEEEEAKQKAQLLLDKSKKQASEIIANANKQATTSIEEAKKLANVEVDKIKTKAKIDIEQDSLNIVNDLRDKLASLVIQGVNKVLEKEVDINTHKDMLNKLSKTL